MRKVVVIAGLPWEFGVGIINTLSYLFVHVNKMNCYRRSNTSNNCCIWQSDLQNDNRIGVFEGNVEIR